jgi:hypothetical protein
MALREHADDAGQCLLSRKSTDGVIRSGPERRFLLRLLRPIAHSEMPTTRTWAEAEKTDTATRLQVCHALKY